MDLLIIAVLGTLAIAAASQLSDRIGVAPALILLAGGTAVGFLPFIPAIELDPQVVLEGILPPLLFSTAVSISTINFRRELAPVAVLAILLVPLSAAVIGAVLTLLVPGLSLAWAIAMGAILSPTDAVAISIARRLGVSQRIITVLEGEGLLNDATALVVLSSAVSAATSGGVSVGGVLGGFALAVLVALGVGWLVGEVSLRVRSHITDPTVDTVVSFTVPFLAAIPAEHMHGSGLVAAVVAGLITGHRGPRMLPPAHRVASRTNWHTVELTLEGLIFLVMGLEFFGVVEKVGASALGIVRAIAVAVVAGALTVVIRALGRTHAQGPQPPDRALGHPLAGERGGHPPVPEPLLGHRARRVRDASGSLGPASLRAGPAQAPPGDQPREHRSARAQPLQSSQTPGR